MKPFWKEKITGSRRVGVILPVGDERPVVEGMKERRRQSRSTCREDVKTTRQFGRNA